jgi:heat shock protein HtpX
MFLAYQARWFGMFAGGRDDDERGGVLGMLIMAILAPLAASLIQMAISRSREFKADEGAAQLTHDSQGLASALEKLTAYSKRLPLQATRQTAHLFIVSPFSGKSLMNLFSTHPPIEERVARLRAMRLS